MAEFDLSCATIVNLMPRTIKEYKPGLNPTEFIIPKGSPSKPGLLIISGIYYKVNPDVLSEAKDIQWINVPVNSLEAAQSIIMDHVNALPAINDDALPGLFPIKGNFDNPDLVCQKFKNEIHTYKLAQDRWFRNLVDIADDIWAKTKSPLGINDLMREAGVSLGLERDWLGPVLDGKDKKCRYCGELLGGPVCKSCKHVNDEEAYKKMSPVLAAFAQ